MTVPDDPVALRSPVYCRFFARVMRRQMRTAFRAVRVLKPGLPDLPDGAPLVIYANHPSWWDPATFIVLTTTLFPDRDGYGPMEAAALDRYAFMKRIGLFGIDPGARAGAARFLRVGQHVLSDPGRMIWMTAQGRFADPRERPLDLRPGLAHLMARVPRAVALPLGIEYTYWTEKRPEALAAFGAPLRGLGDAAAWQAGLTHNLAATMDTLAAAAIARAPAAFERVLGGTTGVGGVYGIWHRARATVMGDTYRPDHVPDRTADETGRET